jgi:16S rRNA (guanine966-N2)-methyltransferase
MRIISGQHKGRKIRAPKNLPVRPTTDRAKEGLFNILQHRFDLNQVQVLDLFAGTGNISYEFASRGAASVTAIDQNRHCVQFIQNTATALEMSISAIQSGTLEFLKQQKATYDLIFADPPYDFELEVYTKMIALTESLLSPEGIFIVEHDKHIDLSQIKGFNDNRTYGNNVFSFFSF